MFGVGTRGTRPSMTRAVRQDVCKFFNLDILTTTFQGQKPVTVGPKNPPLPCLHVRSTQLVTSPFALSSSTMLRWASVNSFSAFCSQSRSDRPRSSSCSASSASGRPGAPAFWSAAEHPAKPLRRLPSPYRA